MHPRVCVTSGYICAWDTTLSVINPESVPIIHGALSKNIQASTLFCINPQNCLKRSSILGIIKNEWKIIGEKIKSCCTELYIWVIKSYPPPLDNCSFYYRCLNHAWLSTQRYMKALELPFRNTLIIYGFSLHSFHAYFTFVKYWPISCILSEANWAINQGLALIQGFDEWIWKSSGFLCAASLND